MFDFLKKDGLGKTIFVGVVGIIAAWFARTGAEKAAGYIYDKVDEARHSDETEEVEQE